MMPSTSGVVSREQALCAPSEGEVEEAVGAGVSLGVVEPDDEAGFSAEEHPASNTRATARRMRTERSSHLWRSRWVE